MHESRLEDQIRQALRADGDSLPLTITPAELDRRLDRRRRERSARRVTVVAAAVAVVAIGSIVAIGNGWLRMPAVGVAPSESPMSSPVASSAPSPQPSASATSDARPARPLGGPGDAIVVRSIIDPTSVVHQIEVQLWPAEGDMSVIATYSGILGGNPSPDVPARVSSDGFLAIPLAGWKDPERHCCVAIYDLVQPARDPQIIEDLGSEGVIWGPDGRLALFDPLVITVVEPYGGGRTSLPVPAGVVVAASEPRGGVWALDGDGFVAWRQEGLVGGPGTLRFDGTFTSVRSPDIYAPFGIERWYDPVGRQLLVGCDTSDNEPGEGCSLLAEVPGGAARVLYREASGDGRISDQRWDTDGRRVWLLLERPAIEGRTFDLVVRTGEPGTFVDRAILSGIEVRAQTEPRLAGIASGGGRVAITLDPGLVALVDIPTGRWVAPGGSFAGWADQRGAGG